MLNKSVLEVQSWTYLKRNGQKKKATSSVAFVALKMALFMKLHEKLHQVTNPNQITNHIFCSPC